MKPVVKTRFALKLGLAFSVVFLVGGTLAVSRMYYQAEALLEQQITVRLQEQAFHTMDKIDQVLHGLYEETRAIAADPVVSDRRSTQKELSARLGLHRNRHKALASLAFYGPGGTLISHATVTLPDPRRRFDEPGIAIPRGSGFAAGVELSSSLDRPVLYLAFPVREGVGTHLGVVVSRMFLDVFRDMVHQAAGVASAAENIHVDLVDRDGRVLISDHDVDGILKGTSEDWAHIKDLIADGRMAGSLRYRNPEEGIGEELLVFERQRGYRDFGGNGWTLIVFTPTADVFSPAAALRNDMILALFVSGAAILLLMAVLLRRFVGPLGRLQAAMEAFGKGDARVRVAVASDDEIGAISASFNTMAVEIEGAREALQDRARDLEQDVAARTAELRDLNGKLTQDIEVRKRTEEALRLSEEKWSKAFHSTPNGIVLTTLSDGRYIEVNEAYLQMSGYSREDLIGRSSLDLGIWVDPEDRGKLVAALRVQGQAADQMTRFRTKSGRVLDVLITAEMIEYGDEPIMISVSRDVTAQKKAEQDLRRAKEFSESIFNSMHEAIAIVNVADLTIVDANRVFVEHAGQSREELIGKPCHAITHRSPEPCAMRGESCPVALMTAAGTTQTAEHCHELAGGRKKCFEATAAPVRDEAGTVVQAVYVTKDITERRLAEERIRTSEKQYRDLFDSSMDGVYRVSADGIFTAMNPAGARIFGYERPEGIIGQAVQQFWRTAGDREIYEKELTLRGSVSVYHIHAKDRNGVPLELESTTRTLYDEHGNFAGMEGILRDITQRWRAQEERESLIRKLQDSLAEVRTLSGLLPICGTCKKVRDDKGYWSQIENYLLTHAGTQVSHGFCPECTEKALQDIAEFRNGNGA